MRALLGRCLLVVLLLFGSTLSLARHEPEEQALLAVFLGRFASYVEWPPADGEAFVIGVVDDEALGKHLQQLYADRHIRNQPVVVHQLDGDSLQNGAIAPNLLFIGSPQSSQRQRYLEALRDQPVLTISTARGFAANGGIIQINFVAQHARITINHAAALAQGLRISAPLLSIATVIGRD